MNKCSLRRVPNDILYKNTKTVSYESVKILLELPIKWINLAKAVVSMTYQ